MCVCVCLCVSVCVSVCVCELLEEKLLEHFWFHFYVLTLHLCSLTEEIPKQAHVAPSVSPLCIDDVCALFR